MIWTHSNKDTHPNFTHDFPELILEYDAEKYYFACQSLEKLEAWFGEFLIPMLEEGYVLAEYKVRDCIEGKSGKQCTFHKDAVLRQTDITKAYLESKWRVMMSA